MNTKIFSGPLIKILAGFFLCGCFNFIFPILSLMLVENGIAPRSAALIQSIGMLSSALLMPLVGHLIDRGYYRLIFIWAIAMALLASLGFFGAVRFLPIGFQSIMSSFFFIAVVSIITTLTKRITEGTVEREKLTQAASLTYLVENTAIGISSIVAFLLIGEFKFELGILDGTFKILFLILLFTIYEESNSRSIAQNKSDSPSGIPKKFQLNGQLLLLFSSIGFVLVTILCHGSAIPLLFASQGLNAKALTSLMLLTNTCAVVCTTLIVGKYSSRIRNEVLFLSGAFLTGLGHMLMPFGLTEVGIVLLTIVWSVGEGLVYPSMTTLILQQFSQTEAGKAVGMKIFIWRTASIIAPLMASVIQDRSVGYFSITFGVMPFIGISVFLYRSYKFRKKSFNEKTAYGGITI